MKNIQAKVKQITIKELSLHQQTITVSSLKTKAK
jgi:hypothetical protein